MTKPEFIRLARVAAWKNPTQLPLDQSAVATGLAQYRRDWSHGQPIVRPTDIRAPK